MNSYPRLKSGVAVRKRRSSHSSSHTSAEEFFVGLPTRGISLFSPHTELVLRAFTGQHTTSHIAASLKLELREVEEIQDALELCELIEFWPKGIATPGDGVGDQHRTWQAEIQRDLITHRAGARDGGVREMALRSEFTILISGENRCARTLLTLLQSMGIIHTRIITRGQLAARVDSYDVCGVTTRMSDVGKKRSDFHQELIRESELPRTSHAFGLADQSAAKSSPDLIISTIPVEWDYVQRWMSEGSAHLHINSLIGGSIELGPYVVPGVSACLRCVALTQRDARIPLGDQSLRKELPASVSAYVAGVVAAVVGELIATGTTPLLGSSIWLNLLQPLAETERRYWQRHPECGCADQAEIN